MRNACDPGHLRRLTVEARVAADTVLQAAEHFNTKPIADYARSLQEATTHAIIILDAELAAIHENTTPKPVEPLSFEKWQEREIAKLGPAKSRCGG